LFHERRGHQHKPVRLVDVVLDYPVVEDDDPRQSGLYPQAGRDTRSTETRQFGLPGRVEPQGYKLADVRAQQVGRGGGHDDFVGPIRIRQPALDSRQTILVEEHAVDAAHGRHVTQRVQTGSAVLAERHDGWAGKAPDAFHAWHAGDLGRQRGDRSTGVGGVHRYRYVRRVGARKEGRIRGLGAPGGNVANPQQYYRYGFFWIVSE